MISALIRAVVVVISVGLDGFVALLLDHPVIVRLELGYIVDEVINEALYFIYLEGNRVFHAVLLALDLLLCIFVQSSDKTLKVIFLTANLRLKLRGSGIKEQFHVVKDGMCTLFLKRAF